MFNRENFEEICLENNIEPKYAPTNGHRTIDLVERLIQAIRQK